VMLEAAAVGGGGLYDGMAVGDGDEIDLTPKPGAEEPYIPPVAEEE
jgi:hypothetical protein